MILLRSMNDYVSWVLIQNLLQLIMSLMRTLGWEQPDFQKLFKYKSMPWIGYPRY